MLDLSIQKAIITSIGDMMQTKCLMIETSDKKFFTLIKNRKQLVEYCKTFKSKMSVVKAEIKKEQVLDLSKLVPALCDKNYKNTKIEYKIIKNYLIK